MEFKTSTPFASCKWVLHRTISICIIMGSLISLSTGVCNSPPDMENASHNGGGGSAFQEDEKVVYTCNAGYRSSDNGATICESNGEWYPSDFQYTCRPVNCGDPGYLENGERNQEVFTFGQQLIFSCNYGYTMQGYEGSICMANGLWSSPLPVCQPVECPMPNGPSDGEMFPTIGPFTYKTKVTISCLDPYQRPDPPEILCTAEGSWTVANARCTDITCDDSYLKLQDAEVDAEDGLSIGSSISFRCNNNTTMDGPSDALCRESGEWSTSQPTCWRMCPVPDIINGSASVDGSAISGPKFIQHERYIRYLCDTGFILKGNHTAFCKNGTFNSAIPSCVHDEGGHTPHPPRPPPTTIRGNEDSTKPSPAGHNTVLTIVLSFLGGLFLVLILGLLAWCAVKKCKEDDQGDFKKAPSEAPTIEQPQNAEKVPMMKKTEGNSMLVDGDTSTAEATSTIMPDGGGTTTAEV